MLVTGFTPYATGAALVQATLDARGLRRSLLVVMAKRFNVGVFHLAALGASVVSRTGTGAGGLAFRS